MVEDWKVKTAFIGETRPKMIERTSWLFHISGSLFSRSVSGAGYSQHNSKVHKEPETHNSAAAVGRAKASLTDGDSSDAGMIWRL